MEKSARKVIIIIVKYEKKDEKYFLESLLSNGNINEKIILENI
jgi:hypothetical protein